MVRWGLLSTARINRKLIPAIRASKRGRLMAVASRTEVRANEYAKIWEIPHAFGDYDSMLNSDMIDAVYISLPNHLHAEWTIKSLEAGKHVLCEKPLALSVAQVEQMIAASQRNGCVLAEAFMYRHHPQIKLVGEWVQTGRLGEIALVRGAFHFSIHDRDDIRLKPEMGGGSLWDVGVYPVSMAQFVYRNIPDRVMGEQWTGDSGADETFTGMMHYPSGGLAQISSSLRTPRHTTVEIIGTHGSLSLNRPFIDLESGAQLIFQPAEGKSRRIPVPKKELYLGEVEDMNAAILDAAAPYLSLRESLDHVRTIVALYTSARNGKPYLLQ